VLVRQCIEEGGFTGARQTSDTDLHSGAGFSPDEPSDLGAFFEVFVLADKEAHALANYFDAVAQSEIELIGLVDGSLERRQSGQRVKRGHWRTTF
jgi:hypothetical protein